MSAEPPISDLELVRELERELGRPSEYRTSFAIEEVDAWWLGEAEPLRLMLKDVRPEALSEEARGAKPAFLRDPLRELEVYRLVLAPRLYAAGSSWLLLERIAGVELYQVGEREVWQAVARWLADLHASCREVRVPSLLVYDRVFYRGWLERALAFRGGPELEALARGYDGVVERLLALPVTLVHGEFYASNVLVEERAGGLRVCPVDWETAAVAPGLVDLAALTSGRLSEEQRLAIARAYHEALPAGRPGWGELLEALDCCRLHLAVQWLGWSKDWTPPPEHAQDWFREALLTAKRIGLS